MQTITIQNGNVNFEADEGVLYNFGKTELLYYPASKEGDTFAMPSPVKKIMSESFAYCQNLVRLQINEGFEEILPGAFYMAQLKEIVFSSTVKKVDLCSFPCYFLELLDFNAMTEPFEVTNILEVQKSAKLFNVFNVFKLKIIVSESFYDVFYQMLNLYTVNYGDLIDISGYSDAAVTVYTFINGDETETVRARKLTTFPIPQWKGGEPVQYFQGWFADDGIWQEEIALPAQNELGTIVTFYAKWGSEERRDGTMECFAYLLEINTPKTITVTAEKPIVYFETLVEPETEEFFWIILVLFIDGEECAFIELYELPANKIVKSCLDFTEYLDSFPAEIEIEITMIVE